MLDNAENRQGKLLRKKRQELGLSQEKVALELGMSLHQYQRYEYGEFKLSNSRMKTGLRMCLLLELDPYAAVFDGDIWGDLYAN